MKIRPFEIGLVAFFIISAIVGLVIVSRANPENPEARLYGDRVLIWGTFDSRKMEDMLYTLSKENKALEVVTYRKIDPRTFDSDLINAIAEGKSPDVVILPHSKLVTHRSKLQPLSYEYFGERQFRDTYLDGAEIFTASDGVYGIPLAVDPLVMYWNRDIFATSGLSQPPKTWDTLISQTTKAITKIDNNRGVTRATIAFGEYTNILHAKEILSMLFLQAGSTLVDLSGTSYKVTLNNTVNNSLKPAEAVLNFYTQFALSNKELYSWNRSKQLDRSEFLKGDLALYFGLGSEYASLERDNVNLNFDIAAVPQDANATILRNYADYYALVIPRGSKNQSGGFAVAQYLAQPGPAQDFADSFDLVPALRSLHPNSDINPVKNITYPSSLIARGWFDPNPTQSSEVFRSAVERVTSGQSRVENVIYDAITSLESLF